MIRNPTIKSKGIKTTKKVNVSQKVKTFRLNTHSLARLRTL